LRRARGIRIPGGIEGVATTPALHLRNSRWRCLWFLDDRCRSGNLLVVTRLGLWLPERRIRLYRRRRGDAGLTDGRLTAGGGLRAALKQLQAIFELPVAVLQLLILAGELPQLIFKLLNSQFRVDIIGLRERL
jgi:hypothetical protein